MSETVLVVDDDTIASALVRHVLSPRGIRVIERRSGPAALLWLESHVADLILMETALPELSGAEVCRQIRATEHHRSVPIFMLSKRDRFADRAEAQAAGADLYLVKPLSASRLIELAQRFLVLRRFERRRSRDEGYLGSGWRVPRASANRS
jgi:DNA-binding response OmpR family regulator